MQDHNEAFHLLDLCSRGYLYPVPRAEVKQYLNEGLETDSEAPIEGVLSIEVRNKSPLTIYMDDFQNCTAPQTELIRKIALASEPCDFPLPFTLPCWEELLKTRDKPMRSKILVFLGPESSSVEIVGKRYGHAALVNELNAVVLSHPCNMIENPQLKISAWKSIQRLSNEV